MAPAPTSACTANRKACERCGSVFDRRAGLSAAQWRDRRFCSRQCAAWKRAVTDDVIRSLYASGRSAAEIGLECGLSQVHVARILRGYGDIRPPSVRQKMVNARPQVIERQRVAHRGRSCPEHVKAKLQSVVGPAHPLWRGGKTVSAGYEVFTSSPANGERAGRSVHSVVYEEKTGVRSTKLTHIHHMDHDKRNNAPSNLTVLSAAEHARHHAANRRSKSANG